MISRNRLRWTSPVLTRIWDEAWDKRSIKYKPLGDVRRSPEYTGSIAPSTPIYHSNPTPFQEEIFDEGSSNAHFKDCVHNFNTQTYSYVRVPLHLINVASSNLSAMRVTPAVKTTMEGVMAIPEYDMDNLASQAMAFMLPSVNQGTSVLNFAWELREMKQMDPRDALRRVKYGATSLKLLRDRKTRNGFMKDTARRMAGAHLAAEFGIIPFVKDVVDIYDQLSTIEDRMKKIKQFAGRPLTRHYKRVLPYEAGKFWPKAYTETKEHTPVSNISGDPWVHWYWGANGAREALFEQSARVYCTKTWIQRPTYHATLRYSYELPRFDTELGEKIAVYTELLGIRLDPTIPWNALRLSFLVDWVVDVSGFLSSFARENYQLEYKILDFCHSLKWHSESTISVFEPNYSYRYGPLDPNYFQDPYPKGWDKTKAVEVYKETDKHYERFRTTPSILGMVPKFASLRKAALAGSLMISNANSIKKGRAKYLRLLPQLRRGTSKVVKR